MESFLKFCRVRFGFAKNNDIDADISAAWNVIEDALNRVLKHLACAVSAKI